MRGENKGGSCFSLHPLRRRFRPTFPQVDGIDDPRDRIEAENREGDPSPVVTLREEPGEECVNDAADDHGCGAGFKEGAQSKAVDERVDAEIVTPPVTSFVWVAPLEAAIERERSDDWPD